MRNYVPLESRRGRPLEPVGISYFGVIRKSSREEEEKIFYKIEEEEEEELKKMI